MQFQLVHYPPTNSKNFQPFQRRKCLITQRNGNVLTLNIFVIGPARPKGPSTTQQIFRIFHVSTIQNGHSECVTKFASPNGIAFDCCCSRIINRFFPRICDNSCTIFRMHFCGVLVKQKLISLITIPFELEYCLVSSALLK